MKNFHAVTYYLLLGLLSIGMVTLDFVTNSMSNWEAYLSFVRSFGTVYLPGLAMVILASSIFGARRAK